MVIPVQRLHHYPYHSTSNDVDLIVSRISRARGRFQFEQASLVLTCQKSSISKMNVCNIIIEVVKISNISCELA